MAAAAPPMEMDNSMAIQSKRESFCFRARNPRRRTGGMSYLGCPSIPTVQFPSVDQNAPCPWSTFTSTIQHQYPRWTRTTAAAAAMEVAAEAGTYEEMLRVVEACAARIRWRLRPQSKRRLLNDILFLCTGLRPVILMDYGGTMPQLQDNLCSLLHRARQEASILNPLRVMVINDMLYLIHLQGLAEHVSPNGRSQHQLAFVDLEKSCCELLANTEKNETMVELLSIQDRFSATFPVEADVEPGATDVECSGISIPDTTSLVVDLTAFLECTQIALPSLNGWLLGYPVTYLFRIETAEAATKNLSNHSLHIYRIYVVRHLHSDAKQSEEELLSFSVPCDMSTKRDKEPWARSFLARMNEKLERCSHVWASVRLEVQVFQSQLGVIVL